MLASAYVHTVCPDLADWHGRLYLHPKQTSNKYITFLQSTLGSSQSKGSDSSGNQVLFSFKGQVDHIAPWLCTAMQIPSIVSCTLCEILKRGVCVCDDSLEDTPVCTSMRQPQGQSAQPLRRKCYVNTPMVSDNCPIHTSPKTGNQIGHQHDDWHTPRQTGLGALDHSNVSRAYPVSVTTHGLLGAVDLLRKTAVKWNVNACEEKLGLCIDTRLFASSNSRTPVNAKNKTKTF